MRGVKRIHGVRWAEWLGSRNRRVAFTPDRPARVAAVVPRSRSRLRLLAGRADPAAGEGGDRRLGNRRHAPGPCGPDRRRAYVRRPARSPTCRVTGRSSRARSPRRSNNAEGIAGIGLPAQLLVAKVVRADGTISLEAEAKAIRWAVDAGRARDQPQPRRPARPAQPVAATRTRRSRPPRSTTPPRRESSSSRPSGTATGAGLALAVRELPGRAAARRRRQLARA